MGKLKTINELHKEASDEGQRLCKNADLEIVIVNHGCKEERRDGSAWCQKCSDAHKKKQEKNHD
jgi:hypothetical protein